MVSLSRLDHFLRFRLAMSLSRLQRVGMTPAELEFIALEVEIDIIPLFSLDSLFNLDKVALLHYTPLTSMN